MEGWSEYAKLKSAYVELMQMRYGLPKYTRTAIDDELDRMEALLQKLEAL